jgi:hypothetical protein
MKYVVSLLFGLVLGVAVAAAALYFNPLSRSQSAPLSNPERTLEYKLAGSGVWLSTHDDRLDLPVVPRDVPLLYEDGIRGTWLSALALEDKTMPGTIGATRISVPSPESELIRSGLLVEDFWLISVPENGSLFVHAMNNQWPLLRDTVVKVDWLGRDFAGPAKYDPTRGPANGAAEVFGLTGTYRELEGRAREHVMLESYAGGLSAVSGQLALRMSDRSED